MGLQRRSGPDGGTPPRSEDKRSVLSGSHTVSLELQRTTQAVRGTEPRLQGGDTGPQKEQGESVGKVVFAQSLRRPEVLVRRGHRKKPVLAGLKIFIFSLSLFYFLRFSTMKSYLEMFRYSHIQKKDSMYFKSLKFVIFKIIQMTSITNSTQRGRE